MEKLLTFEEVLFETKGKKRKLLLGNGFSMAYDSERFSFTSLYKSALDKNIIKKNSEIHKIFENFETSDFEEVIKVIESSSKIAEFYGIDLETITKMKDHADKLKEFLVDIITNNHPEKANEISDIEYDICIDNFIKYFDEIYTLNYDLLLYWLTMRLQERKLNKSLNDCTLIVNDGFSDVDAEGKEYVVFQDTPYGFFNQKIFYLHGALHIFDKKYQIIKNTNVNSRKKPLREQTLSNLKKSIYPVFISEGTSEQKLSKIVHNSYLNQCYKKFKNLDGILVIFGTGLKNSDDHILNAIINNKKNKKVYLGVRDISKISDYDLIKERLNNDGRSMLFFDYKTVKLWR